MCVGVGASSLLSAAQFLTKVRVEVYVTLRHGSFPFTVIYEPVSKYTMICRCTPL